jgi:peroxiredoxin
MKKLTFLILLLLTPLFQGCSETTTLKSMPDVDFTLISGQKGSFKQFKGRVVLVNFWSVNCPVCLEEMSAWAELYQQFKSDNFKLIGVAMPYDPPSRIVQTINRFSIPYETILDLEGKVVNAFRDVPGTPTSYLIDKNGVILVKMVGKTNFKQLINTIQHEI